MARNGSGVYSLPLSAVVSGNNIEATWANASLDDIASALSDSLSRSGNGNMTAPLRVPDGSNSAPALAFSNATNMGFYRVSASEFRGVLASASKIRVTSNTDMSAFQVYDADNTTWQTLATSERAEAINSALDTRLDALEGSAPAVNYLVQPAFTVTPVGKNIMDIEITETITTALGNIGTILRIQGAIGVTSATTSSNQKLWFMVGENSAASVTAYAWRSHIWTLEDDSIASQEAIVDGNTESEDTKILLLEGITSRPTRIGFDIRISNPFSTNVFKSMQADCFGGAGAVADQHMSRTVASLGGVGDAAASLKFLRFEWDPVTTGNLQLNNLHLSVENARGTTVTSS